MEKLYTVEEAADYLSVTRQAIYKYMKRGVLRYVTLKGMERGRRIPESALREFLQESNPAEPGRK